MNDTPDISLENVFVHYDQFVALENINLTINHRDFLGIMGPNGGGKTTLLKTMLGLIQPVAGKVLVMGEPPVKSRSMIGYVQQFMSFDRTYPTDVWDVVMMGRLSKTGFLRSYNKTDKEKVADVLNVVGMYQHRHRQIGKLSGGQMQRALIARALAPEPQILLLDEPTASIDIQTEQGLYDLFDDLNQKLTIIMVSHDIGAISSHVKTIACLNRKLHYHGSRELTPEVIESVYGCPIELIGHGIPHRVLKKHNNIGHTDV
jgi:zinc transport system ATP-binding protein